MVIPSVLQPTQLHIAVAILIIGAVIGVAGHITRIRLLILAGILVVGIDAVVFVVSARPASG